LQKQVVLSQKFKEKSIFRAQFKKITFSKNIYFIHDLSLTKESDKNCGGVDEKQTEIWQ
jgi:hypothetical protein